MTAVIKTEGALRAAVSAVGSFWQGPNCMEVPVDEGYRVIQGSFLPYVGLTQALIPALGPDTHFIKLNGILSLQAVPHVSALGVSAAAQIAWTRFLIAEATESTPWITELVIDSLVRTRSSQTLPKEYISGDDIAHEILRIVTEENEHQIATIGKGPGDAEVEFVPVRSHLNNALVNADISNGYEEYLAFFDHFYDENVEVASDSNPDPLVGKARVVPIIFNFLMPLHVTAEIGGLSVRLRYTPLFSGKQVGRNSGYPRRSKRACREYLPMATAAAVLPSGWLSQSVTGLWRSAASTIW